MPVNQVLTTSLIGSVIDLIPQIIFTYYLIYYGINNIIRKKRALAINIIEILAVLFLCVLLFRSITNYIELPYLYKRVDLRSPLLEMRRVLGVIVDMFFAFGLMLLIKSVRDKLEATEREKNLVKQKLETELKFLKSQINPHFLLNTLNNIYALARKKSDDTAEVVMRLSEMLRFMLYESNERLIKLSDEIKVLEDYLDLETLRYDKRLSISFEKNIDNDCYKITPFLLLPFVENAFKHGISESRFESYININITVQNDLFNFEIENSNDTPAHKKGIANIGLINVKRQLELTYSDYKLDVEEADHVFKVNLSVNLNSYVEI